MELISFDNHPTDPRMRNTEKQPYRGTQEKTNGKESEPPQYYSFVRPISATSRDTSNVKMLETANSMGLTNFTVSEKKSGLARSRVRKSHQPSIGDTIGAGGRDSKQITISHVSEDSATARATAKQAATATALSMSTGGIKHSRPPSGRIKIQLDPDASKK